MDNINVFRYYEWNSCWIQQKNKYIRIYDYLDRRQWDVSKPIAILADIENSLFSFILSEEMRMRI
jgi:hypothetical protein